MIAWARPEGVISALDLMTLAGRTNTLKAADELRQKGASRCPRLYRNGYRHFIFNSKGNGSNCSKSAEGSCGCLVGSFRAKR